MKTQFTKTALALACTVGLSGCGVTSVGDAFSGGSSMRIDVEVYKGPLSKNIDVQWGELTAVILEAQTALTTFDDDLLRSASAQGYLVDAELPPTELDIWGKTNTYKIKEFRKTLDKADADVRSVGRLLNQELKILETISTDLNNVRDAYNVTFFFASRLASDVQTDGDNLSSTLAALKSATSNLSEIISPLPEKFDTVPWDSMPDAAVKDVTQEQLNEGKAKLNDVKNALNRVKDEVNKLENIELTDLGARLKSKVKRDLNGPITITPFYRGLSRRDDRKNIPSRTVSKVRGIASRSDKDSLVWCNSAKYRQALEGDSSDLLIGYDCLKVAQLHDEIDHLNKIIQTFKDDFLKGSGHFGRSLSNVTDGSEEDQLTELLTYASEIGSRLKAKAFFWAGSMMAVPPGRVARSLATAFTNVTAEYGNQIASRADTILKQCPYVRNGDGSGEYNCDNGIAKRLPLSVYLREINPTEFHNLFIYNRSGGLATVEETFSRPVWNLGTEESSDRSRVVEKLFADHNWSNINTVYASGQGDVSMAFIKDSIGNWNLKNFKSDPTELLEGYKNITVAAAKAAVELIGDAGTAGAPSALALASNMMRGRVGPGGQNTSGIDVDRLAEAVERQIESIIEAGKIKEAEIKREVKKKTPEIKCDDATKAEQTEGGEGNRDCMIKANKQATHKQLLDLLTYHDKTLESLQSAVAASAGASLDEKPKE